VISLSAVDPVRDGRGWAFRAGDGYGLDPVNGFALLREAYEATEPGYDGHVSVPLLWDRQTGAIVSNGVYRCGFAGSQESYHEAFGQLFATLDDLERRLGQRRYLTGDTLTEADVRLWVTLAT
jgi:putative glutathione S-transferase